MAFMYHGPQSAWVNAQHQKRMQEQTDTSELEGLQLELLKAEVANAKASNQGDAELSRQAGEMSKQYLDQWNKGLEQAGGMYNSAIGEITKAQGMVSDAYKDISGNLGKMSEDIGKEWETMKTTYGDIKGDLIGATKESLGQRGELRRQFMDLTRADEEGEASRAMTDVAAMSEAGRKAEAMRLQGLGIDPTSGRGRSAMRLSRNDEVRNKVMAANKARGAEKERVAGLTAQGLQLIDPSQDINAATAIQDMQNRLLQSRSNLEVNRANVQGNLASTTANLASQRGNLATGFAQNVVAPKGDMGATQLGVSQGARGTGGSTAPSGGSRKMELFRQTQQRGADLRAKYYGT
jgi:hypothetical protein